MRNFRFALRAFTLGVLLFVAARAADETKKSYNLPAGDAASALKQFSEVSGRETLFAADVVRGVRTAPVKGEFTAKEALDQMLATTGLVAMADEKTGAFAVRKDGVPEKNDLSRRAESSAAAGASAVEPLKLDEFHVLGSRIRQTDSEGPSPVDTYDREYISATGALTLSDFLNTLPQTYGGISAGRGSVPSDLNIDFGRRTENVTPGNPNIGASPLLVAPVQTGVSGVSLRGLGGASTLVLVDGRRVVSSGVGNSATDSKQSFVDLNSIPLGLIERIEITTDGSSAIYGADAVAGVINIVLKKQYFGSEISGTVKLTEHGGGRERQTTVTSGITRGKLRGTVSLNYYDRSVMYASQRAFSKNMDHSGVLRGFNPTTGAPIFGTDMRIQFGYAPSVQLAAGNLNGLSTPARVALTPIGATTTPTPAQFIPITTIAPGQSTLSAQGQRVTNESQSLELVPRSRRWGITSNFNYKLSDRLEAFATFSYTDSFGKANALPAYNGLAATTIVPAAFSPFGQDVQVGMIHYEFGTVWQSAHSETASVSAGLHGSLARAWQWDASASWQRRDLYQRIRNFNPAALPAALANPDATKRLNPFIDAFAAGLDRSAIYETMAIYPKVDSSSELHSLDASADGAVMTLPGGDLKAAFGGSSDRQKNHNVRTNVTAVAVPVTSVAEETGARTSFAAFAELSVPFFGKKNALPLLRRLETRVAARYQNQGAAGHSTVPKYGLTWSPVQSLLLRASYSEGFRVPGLTELETSFADLGIVTLNDPRRNNAATPILIRGGSNPSLKPETSTNEFYGVVFEPTFAKGLSLKANYYRTIQINAIQQASRTTILNNESYFTDRITRAAPSAADTAAGLPGIVTEIRTALINFGRVQSESVDFAFEYRLPWQGLGRWRFAGNAARTLKSVRELIPGQAIDDSGDTYSPPRWKAQGAVFWSRGPVTASGTMSYLSGFGTNKGGISSRNTADGTPAIRKVNLRAGYEFQRPIWHGHGRGVRLNFGVSNIFDAKPPFYDVVYGYNAALHSDYVWGRAYEFSFALPF